MAFREQKLLQLRLAGGSIERYEFDNHIVDVWLPADLNPKTPVLVMHDGRNIFDEKDSYTGKTWEVLPAIRDEVRGPSRLSLHFGALATSLDCVSLPHKRSWITTRKFGMACLPSMPTPPVNLWAMPMCR